MGGAAAVLGTRWRVVAGVAIFAALFAYDDLSSHLWNASIWWDVAWLAFALMPLTFSLVLLALPLHRWGRLLPVGLAFAVLAAVLTAVHANVLANFSRLSAATLLGWWFLSYFEELSWVVLIAFIIPWVDAYSVWRGPTKEIVAHHEHVFSVLSYAFPVPGEHAAANLGVPDLLFFALFLGAAARFGLRVVPTWAALIAGLGATIALTIWLDLSGLPALPGIALGFLVPNADLIYRRLRGQPRLGGGPDVARSRPANDL